MTGPVKGFMSPMIAAGVPETVTRRDFHTALARFLDAVGVDADRITVVRADCAAGIDITQTVRDADGKIVTSGTAIATVTHHINFRPEPGGES